MNQVTGFFTTRNLTANLEAPTPEQASWFAKRGVSVPASKAEASAQMQAIIAREETSAPSKAMLGKAYMTGIGLGWCGKDLPGAGVREISTQIKLLVAVENIQRAMLDESKGQDEVDAAVQVLMGAVLERFAKAMPVERRVVRQAEAPAVPADAPAALI